MVPIDAVRLTLFLSVLNSMQACAADWGNAFLYGKTHEKYYIVSGPEFGELEGRILLMNQSLHGLKTLAARRNEFLSAT